MKNVLGCEGKSEVALIEQLLTKGELVFTKKELLDMRPIHFRQPKDIAAIIDILPIDEDIVFYRIGDTQRDEYDFSCFRARQDHISVIKVCTTPEIEILIIINEGLMNEYNKVKSNMMPKQFVKQYVKGFTNFNDYIATHDMVAAIKEYKRIKKQEKDTICLADLLKK